MASEKFEESSDFANYFCTYAFLYHQKQMLTDEVRMQAYYKSVFNNQALFKDKVVLDVGTGSGILALWSAIAGARKVYAVEATDMAKHARSLVKCNGLEAKIEVIQGKVEDIDLPEKVDIIISEWMGYFLLRESMLDSVLVARDRWLKPGGSLFPSHASMYIAPVNDEEECMRKVSDFNRAMDDWSAFIEDTRGAYGVDMSVLSGSFRQEQEDYFLRTSLWVELTDDKVIGAPSKICELDLLKISVKDIEEIRSRFFCPIQKVARLSSFAGWFDVDFKGSPQNPAPTPVTLSTAPYIGYTHWGQQSFLVAPPIQVCDGDVVEGGVHITRRRDNHRLLNVKIDFALKRVEAEAQPPQRQVVQYHID